MNNTEQQFLKSLDDKLWKAADKLRANLDAANYKHVVLGLIFLKYVSDAFEERQEQLIELFKTDSNDNIYHLPREDFNSDADYQQALQDELEMLDYYREANVFWVPKAARWNTLKEKVVLPIGSVLWQDEAGQDVKLRSVSWLIDNALEAIENSNAKLKGILNRISQYQLDNDKLIGLINTFSDTSFIRPVFEGEKLELQSKDILGHVYEYFLGQFALAEGKQGGQYYTPKSIVTLMVEMLEPYSGRVYDPAMGSGGFFVSSSKFIENHAQEQHYDAAEQKKHISVYGQESNPTTWKLAAMNMAIRGIDFNFGKKDADTFLDDQHPDLRADFIMANPPFNIKDWWSESLVDDVRWKYGLPPKGNANFAWVQHMLHHLAPTGSMGLLLANGSMSSNTNNEGEIRKRLVEEDLVECMVALPGQLFTNTQIPACIWFLTKDKANGLVRNEKKRDRRGELLFIDARNLGYMRDRVLRDFTAEDIAKVTDTFHAWQRGNDYEDVAGFCYSASLDDIKKHDFVLTPGRYVGAEEQEDDGEPFAEKMARLTGLLGEQFAESERLEAELSVILGGLGMNSDWPVIRLGDHVDSCLGKMLDKKKNKGIEQPYLGNSNVRWGHFDLSDLAQMKFEEREQERYSIKSGDLIICEGGEPGRCAIWDEQLPDMKIQKALHRVRPKASLNNYYLYYWFLYAGQRKSLEPYFTGTTIKHLTGVALNNLEMSLPSMEHQEFVARTLSILDKKIELNQQINQTLEQMAQAIFKSWFVDFEPVKANIAALEAGGSEDDALFTAMQVISGKDPQQLNQLQTENPEHYATLRATAELFPAAMRASELGEIPEGWNVATISEFGDVVCGKTPSKQRTEYYGNEVPFIKIPDMHGNVFVTKANEYLSSEGAASQPKKNIPKGSICVSCIATVGLVVIAVENSHTNQQINSIVPKNEAYTPYLYFRMKSLNRHLHDLASGGSATLNLNTGHFSKIQIIKPVDAILNLYQNYAAPLLDAIHKNSNESNTLAELRDTLLPKLLSGELSVNQDAN